MSFERSQKDVSPLYLAMEQKNFNAVKSLITKGITFPQNDAEFTSMVKALFVSNEASSDHKTVKQIFDYLYRIPEFKDRLNNLDPDRRDEIFIETVRNGELEVSHLFLDLNTVSNVNHPGEDGHSALHYLDNVEQALQFEDESDESMEIVENFRERLIEFGAELNAVDHHSIEQETFRKDMSRAIKKNQDVSVYFNRLSDNPALLNETQFLNVFMYAVEKNSVQAVKLFIENKKFPEIDLERNAKSISEEIKNPEIAKMLIDYASKNNINLVYSNSFEDKLRGISHVVGLSGTLSSRKVKLGDELRSDYEFGGNTLQNGLYEVSQSLQYYAKINSAFMEFADSLKYSSEASFITDPATYDAVMSESNRDGKPVITSAGWKGHAIGMGAIYDEANNKTYLAISNRGLGGLASCMKKEDAAGNKTQSGTVIYSLDGKLPESFFSDYGCYQGKVAFQSGNDFSLSLSKKLKDFGATMITTLPASSQSHQTCSYVNPKRVIEGMMFVQELMKNQNMDIDKVKAVCLEKYKEFSRKDKAHGIDSLINLYEGLKNSSDQESKQRQTILMNKYISQVFIQRGSLGIEDNKLRSLYSVLSDDAKAKIPQRFVPRGLPVKQTAHQEQFNRMGKNIQIQGGRKEIEKHDEMLTQLLNHLKDSGIGREKIKGIIFEGDHVSIQTAADRNIKAEIREYFKKTLGAEVENIQGQYQFNIKNFNSLNIPQKETMRMKR